MGSGLDRLVDERAEALLTEAAAPPALIVARPSGFPCRIAGAVVVSDHGAGPVSVRSGAEQLPFPSGTFAAVVDTTRPEDPADHLPFLRELARVCRPGGTVAAIACAGLAVTAGPRTLAILEDCLDAVGCDVRRRVPFDVLGTFSPWRLGLGERRERVLAELEGHLAHPAVCAAVHLLEATVVAVLPPDRAGRVAVVARRRAPGAAPPRPAAPEPPPRAALVRPDVAAEALRLMQDDAVVRFAAFLDAELLSRADVGFDLLGYLEEIGRAESGELRPRLWRWPGLEAYRYLGALSHRLARAAVAGLSGGAGPDAGLPATLEYDLVAMFNALVEPGARES
jgi:SAM-dependent methyltransferase